MTETVEEPPSSTDEATFEARTWPARALAAVTFVVAACSSCFLVVGAYAGFYVRPAADDWCIAGVTRTGGISGMVHFFYVEENGRAANAVIGALTYSDGIRGAELLPALVAFTIAVAGVLVLHLAGRLSGWTIPLVASVAVSTCLTALLLFAGPVVYQVFFWSAGSITHTVPTAMALCTLALVMFAMVRGGRMLTSLALTACAVVAFTIGTLSEAFVPVSGLYVAAAALVAWRGRMAGRRVVVGAAAAWIVGLVAGSALLFASPGRAHRQSRDLHQASMLTPAGVGDVVHQWVMTWSVILHAPSYLAAVGAGLLLGAMATPPAATERAGSRRRTVAAVAVALVLLALATLAVVIELRIGYGRNGFYYRRVWENFMYPALGTAAGLGALLGRRLRRTGPPRGILVASLVVGLATTVALVSVFPALAGLSRDVIVRSSAWSRQDARLTRLAAQGREQVRYTPLPIAGLSEPFSHTDYRSDWVSGCLTEYYGLQKLVPSPEWLHSPASRFYRVAHRAGRAAN